MNSHRAQLFPETAKKEDVNAFSAQNKNRKVLIFFYDGKKDSLTGTFQCIASNALFWRHGGVSRVTPLKNIRLIREASAPANPSA